MTVYDVDDVLIANDVVLQQVLPDLLDCVFEAFHFLLVAQNAQDVSAGHDAQFRVERLDDVEVTVSGSVEHDGVDVFKDDMFLCQCFGFILRMYIIYY